MHDQCRLPFLKQLIETPGHNCCAAFQPLELAEACAFNLLKLLLYSAAGTLAARRCAETNQALRSRRSGRRQSFCLAIEAPRYLTSCYDQPNFREGRAGAWQGAAQPEDRWLSLLRGPWPLCAQFWYSSPSLQREASIALVW